MIKLLKNGTVYTPESIGQKDILLVINKIYKISERIDFPDAEILDCSDMIICPGFIDQHLHIIGGGGEQGPASRIPELQLSKILLAGVSTVVGVLGVDDITRNIANLLAKAKSLEIEGINTFIYTGSYGVPTATLTGKVITDIVFIDKVLGVGEIAISDNRSSNADIQQLREIAREAMVGGMLGNKAGIMHIHVGDGKEGLKPLHFLTEESDFPISMFIPTHLNRKKEIFSQAIDYLNNGGLVDFTAGESSAKGVTVPDALEYLVKIKADLSKVTVSSDGNGSIPDGGVGQISSLFNDIRETILVKNLDFSSVIKTVTSNVAKILKLYPQKGSLNVGSDGDILVLNKSDLSIEYMFINGEIFIKKKELIKKGKYE